MSSGSLRPVQPSRGQLCLQLVKPHSPRPSIVSLCVGGDSGMFSWNVLTNVLQPPPILSRSWGREQSGRHAGLELDHTGMQGAGTYLAILICLGEAPLWGEYRHVSSLMIHPQPRLAPSLIPNKAIIHLPASYHGHHSSLSPGGQTTEPQGAHQEPLRKDDADFERRE